MLLPGRLDAIDEAVSPDPSLESRTAIRPSRIDRRKRGGLCLGLDFPAEFGGLFVGASRRQCYRLPVGGCGVLQCAQFWRDFLLAVA